MKHHYTQTLPYYRPAISDDGTWGFTTPTGMVIDSMSQRQALHFAELTRRQDIETAASGVGPFAEILANHFAAEEVPA